ERLRPARIELDGADGVRLPRVLRAVLALFPRRADAPDIIERGVERLGQLDRDFALPDAKILVVAHGPQCRLIAWHCQGRRNLPCKSPLRRASSKHKNNL